MREKGIRFDGFYFFLFVRQMLSFNFAACTVNVMPLFVGNVENKWDAKREWQKMNFACQTATGQYVDLNKATTMKLLSAFPVGGWKKRRDFLTVWGCGCRICSIPIERNSVKRNVDSKNYGNDGFSMKYFMNSNREYSQRSRDALQLTYLSFKQAFSELITCSVRVLGERSFDLPQETLERGNLIQENRFHRQSFKYNRFCMFAMATKRNIIYK